LGADILVADNSDFRRASDLMPLTNLDRVEKASGSRGWVNPVMKRVDVSDLPVCPKEDGGCGHHVQRQSAVACYSDQGEQVGCYCVRDRYLPKNAVCRSCNE
jgi:hypothetical protein